jgi:hypothetical protein
MCIGTRNNQQAGALQILRIKAQVDSLPNAMEATTSSMGTRA